MPDQKTTGGTLTPQASGPRVLLSRLSEHPSQGRHEKLGRAGEDRKGSEGLREAAASCLDPQMYPCWPVNVTPGGRTTSDLSYRNPEYIKFASGYSILSLLIVVWGITATIGKYGGMLQWIPRWQWQHMGYYRMTTLDQHNAAYYIFSALSNGCAIRRGRFTFEATFTTVYLR